MSGYVYSLPDNSQIRTREGAFIPVSDDNADYRALVEAGVEVGAYEPPEVIVPPAKTYKADIWRRATDAEAETIVAVLSQQSVRKQRLFNDATILDHADPEFTELKAGFVQAFGQARADELLAPSA